MTQIIRNAVPLRRKVFMWYWHTLSFHPPVYAHLSHNRLYLHEMLDTIDIWTAVCVFEQWALRTDRALNENWKSGACARESTSISKIRPLIDNELCLPGKTGRMVTQSPTLQVLRPMFQIASSCFGSLSVHCGCHTETSYANAPYPMTEMHISKDKT